MPPETVLPVGLPRDILDEWLARPDNRGLTDADGIRAYIQWKSKRDNKPESQVILEEYPGLQGQAPPAGAVLGSPGFAGPAWAVPGYGNPTRQSSTGAQPSPYEQVRAGLLQLGETAAGVTPVSGQLPLTKRLLEMGARTATVGAGASAVTGGDPVSGALESGARGVAGQLVGEVPHFYRFFRSLPMILREQLGTRGHKTAWAAEDAVDALTGLVRQIPVLGAVLGRKGTAANVLAELTQIPEGGHRPLGRELLGKSIERYERLVERVLGGPGAEVHTPTIWRANATEETIQRYGQVHTGALPTPARTTVTPSSLVGPSGQPLPPTVRVTPGTPGVPGVVQDVVPPMKVAEALDGLKRMSDRAAAASGYEAKVLWDYYERGKKELLARVPPQVAQLYQEALTQYKLGSILMESLSEPGVLFKQGPDIAKGAVTTFDGNKFLDSLMAKGALDQLPEVSRALLRGEERGARDVLENLIMRFRVYKAGESGTFALPPWRASRRGGFTDIYQGRRGPSPLGTSLGIVGIREMATTAPGSYTVE